MVICARCGKATVVDFGFGLYCRTCCRNTTAKPELKHICNLCGVKFANETILNRHIRNEHISTVYSCPICKETYENLEYIAEHLRDKHDIDVEVGVSKKRSKIVKKGNQHIKKMWLCKNCQQSFKSMLAFQKHYAKHKLEKSKLNHVCNICNAKFGSKKSLHKHITKVHNSPIYSCSLCNGTHSNLECIAQHIRNKHEVYVEIELSKKGNKFVSMGKKYVQSIWICEHCNQSFNSVMEYNNHYKIHKIKK